MTVKWWLFRLHLTKSHSNPHTAHICTLMTYSILYQCYHDLSSYIMYFIHFKGGYTKRYCIPENFSKKTLNVSISHRKSKKSHFLFFSGSYIFRAASNNNVCNIFLCFVYVSAADYFPIVNRFTHLPAILFDSIVCPFCVELLLISCCVNLQHILKKQCLF